ncbi:MAG TPA: hypothetical protein VGD60_06690 [Candidatus Acidoferrales bacterium]
MKGILRFSIFAAAVAAVSIFAVPASASPSNLKCNSNKDRVWVYDSLTTFEVQAKLDCAESVEVLDRQEGYVKIRTRSGVVGYIPAASFADDQDLSTRPVQQDSAPSVGVVAKQAQAEEIAKARAADSIFAAGPQPAAASSPATSSRASMMSSSGLAEINRPAPATATRPPAPPTVVASVMSDAAPSRGTAAGLAPAPSDSAAKLETQSTDSSCQSYFSAYGLNSDQLRWIALNRKKLFPGVCPSPDVAHVKFVLIFTHDVSFFSVTMPQSIHNTGGFSDFQPLTPEDNALTSESDADHAHKQYVWLFEYPDGGFNPDTFSPHSQYKFAKVESNSLGSNGGTKVLEDAFRFVDTAAH